MRSAPSSVAAIPRGTRLAPCLAPCLPAPFASMSNSALRADGRRADQLRPITFEPNIAPYATGSVLVSFGRTRVICGATI